MSATVTTTPGQSPGQSAGQTQGPTQGPLTALLVANRGEIALRIIRSARELGLRTVAVYSDADLTAPHVRAADTAVRLGAASPAASYLDIEALLAAARVSGADAVHPGYGFLSERAEFARAVVEAGLVWVGPPADVIEQMGRKDVAREVAVAAGVPVIPRFVRETESSLDVAMTDESGFPVMVKAASGGGGKGMRIVRHPADLEEALAAAAREARSAFGDDTLLLERYVEHGRHVEVQVLADAHGGVVHLFERDCSAQRRHQKVIEEAPAPTISAAVRMLLLDSSVALAREVGYVGAGTVEFLVAGPTGQEEAYFLEMNTRLQVEHPVTEAVVRVEGESLDLVALQLRVAAGEPLPFVQEQVTCTGHAMEARVYAEDAFAGFLPQAGVADRVRWTDRARVDAALESGQAVTSAYDPMLGKVIVHAATREAARHALVAALDDTAILGLTTNLGFLRELADSPAFADHEVDTGWLDAHPGTLAPSGGALAELLGAWALAHQGVRGSTASAFGTHDGWRVSGPSAPVLVELLADLTTGNPAGDAGDPAGDAGDNAGDPAGADTTSRVVLWWVYPDQMTRRTPQGDDHTWTVRSLGQTSRLGQTAGQTESDGTVTLEVDGQVHQGTVGLGAHEVRVALRGHTFTLARPDPFAPGAAAQVTDGTLTSPMPGTVLAVSAVAGAAVDEGDVLVVVEAMKMELALRAPMAGTVASVAAVVGEQVALGAVLVVVDPA